MLQDEVTAIKEKAAEDRLFSMLDKGAESKPCPFCKGTGSCSRCGGRGERQVKKRLFRSKRTVVCGVCHESGKCELCQGTGCISSEMGSD